MKFFKTHILPSIFLFALVGFISTMTSYGAENETALVSKTDFAYFKIILDRNIFDPSRQKPLDRPPVVWAPEPKIERFILIGTMVTDSTACAFFQGTEPNYNAVYYIGDSIASKTIQDIRSDGITLLSDDNPVQLAVSKGFERKDDAQWAVTTATAFARSTNRQPSSEFQSSIASGTNTDSKTSATTTTDSSDILKKLLEKRRQELSQ